MATRITIVARNGEPIDADVWLEMNPRGAALLRDLVEFIESDPYAQGALDMLVMIAKHTTAYRKIFASLDPKPRSETEQGERDGAQRETVSAREADRRDAGENRDV